MRLQKFMAKCGVASRRKSEEIILQGKVKVNDKIIDRLGVKIDLKKDRVEVDNKIIEIEEKKIYIILNKPEGYVTTVNDQFDRPTVIDLIGEFDERIYPVGRLDYDTSGLLLLTNDGDLTYKLTHPSHEVEKTYLAEIEGVPNKKTLDQFRDGLNIDGYITAKAFIKAIKIFKDSTLVRIKIHEGKNRQIRKMCNKINHPVIKLKRIAIGKLELNNLKIGNWRALKEDEIQYLKNI